MTGLQCRRRPRAIHVEASPECCHYIDNTEIASVALPVDGRGVSCY